MPGHGAEQLTQDLGAQRDFVARASPAYARLLEHLAARVNLGLGNRLARVWSGRTFGSFYGRPALLMAAIRFDALCEGEGHPLHRGLVADPPALETITEAAVAKAVADGRERMWDALARRAVQTNETTRAVTWLWPAHLLARAGRDEPVTLVDLGTSAGLNLIADGLPAIWIDEADNPLEILPRPPIATRIGLDVAPLDVRDDETARWLRACVWPGDTRRLVRLEQGIERFRAVVGEPDAPRLEPCSLVDAAERLARLSDAPFVLAVQTIVRDYLSPRDLGLYERSMSAWLAARSPRTALWAELELVEPGETPDRSAAITVRSAGRGGRIEERVLARTHPHPAQLWRDSDAVAELLDAFGRD